MGEIIWNTLSTCHVDSNLMKPPGPRAVEDGYWCYEISDKRDVTLTRRLTNRNVSREGADRMLIRDGKLRREFSMMGEKTTLTVQWG
jgi:hypothetical protein